MEFSSPHPHFTLDLVRQGRLRSTPFTLIDVGCSGGLAPLWRRFEPDLRALAIDPVVTECARLTAAEKNPAVRYFPAFVGLPPDHPFNQARGDRAATDRNPWNRLSAASGARILAERVKQESRLPVLNSWQTENLAPVAKHSLAGLAAQEGLTDVDFIKIDIDGHDLEALHSGEALIRNSPVLGLTLEVNYYGGTGPTEHTFHNTDRLMRSWGFDLFGITSRKYSADAMPNRYEYDIPAQSVSGRPYQGDALYLRDAIGLEGQPELPALSPAKLLKLAALFECFCLADFAAELLLRHGNDLGLDLPAALDQLALSFRNDGVGYEEHMRRFREDPSRFYRNGPM